MLVVCRKVSACGNSRLSRLPAGLLGCNCSPCDAASNMLQMSNTNMEMGAVGMETQYSTMFSLQPYPLQLLSPPMQMEQQLIVIETYWGCSLMICLAGKVSFRSNPIETTTRIPNGFQNCRSNWVPMRTFSCGAVMVLACQGPLHLILPSHASMATPVCFGMEIPKAQMLHALDCAFAAPHYVAKIDSWSEVQLYLCKCQGRIDYMCQRDMVFEAPSQPGGRHWYPAFQQICQS